MAHGARSIEEGGRKQERESSLRLATGKLDLRSISLSAETSNLQIRNPQCLRDDIGEKIT